MSEPSVGDLLAAADREARRLLGRVEPSDGPSLAAGYAGVLHAASQVLSAIPSVGPPARSDPADYWSVRVTQMVGAIDRFKPLQVDPHPSTVRIATTLQLAAVLLHRHAHPGLAHDPEARADADAARLRVARALAAVAHAAGRELHGYIRQLDQTQHRQHRQRTPPRAVPVTPLRRYWIPMMQRQEHGVLDYLTGHLSDLAGERRGTSPAGVALDTELASWSNLAVRAVSDLAVSSTDLHHVAYTQNALLNAAGALAAAAVQRGELAGEAGPHVLRRLEASATQWGTVAHQWTWACTPDAPGAAREVTSASAAVFGALQDAARTGATWASPSEIADRLADLPLVPVLRTITGNADALAMIYQQLPNELATSGRLRAPAAVLLQIATENQAHRNQVWSRPGTDASLRGLPVTMHDVARNRLLPLTPAARQQLDSAGIHLLNTTGQAHQALHAATPAGPAQSGTTRTTPNRRAAPRHPPQHPPQSAPGPGIAF